MRKGHQMGGEGVGGGGVGAPNTLPYYQVYRLFKAIISTSPMVELNILIMLRLVYINC